MERLQKQGLQVPPSHQIKVGPGVAVSVGYVDSTLERMLYEHYSAHKHLGSLIALAYSRRNELQLHQPRQLAQMAITYNRLVRHPNRWQQEWEALYHLLDPVQRNMFYRVVKELERKTKEKEAASRLEERLGR